MKTDPRNTRKPLAFYYLIAMIVLMLLNALVFPALMSPRVTEVGYSDFLQMIEEKRVSEVAMDTELIIFSATDDEGEIAIYKTGLWPDDKLVDRLNESGARFAAAIPTQESPLLNFLTSWIFPILFFVLIGQLMMKKPSLKATLIVAGVMFAHIWVGFLMISLYLGDVTNLGIIQGIQIATRTILPFAFIPMRSYWRTFGPEENILPDAAAVETAEAAAE